MASLSKLEDIAIDIANSMPIMAEDKYTLKNIIIDMVVQSCKEYERDPSFKEEIDLYFQYKVTHSK